MLEGLLPNERCLDCDVCCRFHEAGSPLAPVFSAAEMSAAESAGLDPRAFCQTGCGRWEPVMLQRGGGHWICPGFDEAANRCCIYPSRPLDCRLYPFVLAYDEVGETVSLAADLGCPFVVDNLWTSRFREEAQVIARSIDRRLDGDETRDIGLVAFRRPEFEVLEPLPALTRRLCRADLGLGRLTPQVASDLAPFFQRDRRQGGHGSPASVLVWADLFNLYYRVAGDRLLLFGEDGGGAFLWMPPVGDGDLQPAVEEAVGILARLGRRPDSWRIDNVAEEELSVLEAMGLRRAEHTEEFIYRRSDLVTLAGRRHHGRRAACNFFLKHKPDAVFEPFVDGDIPEALALYRSWAAGRVAVHPDPFFRAQAESAMVMHYRTMRHAGDVGLVGRTLRSGGRLLGYTFGFELPGADTAVILIEVADLAIKGAAAHLFREFCRWWAPLTWINTMSDSGLPNLRRAKMACHPERLLPVYTMRPAGTT